MRTRYSPLNQLNSNCCRSGSSSINNSKGASAGGSGMTSGACWGASQFSRVHRQGKRASQPSSPAPSPGPLSSPPCWRICCRNRRISSSSAISSADTPEAAAAQEPRTRNSSWFCCSSRQNARWSAPPAGVWQRVRATKIRSRSSSSLLSSVTAISGTMAICQLSCRASACWRYCSSRGVSQASKIMV